MTDKLTKCAACDGRGYFYCDCHQADCICRVGDETCAECGGEGIIDPSYDCLDTPPPQPNVRVKDLEWILLDRETTNGHTRRLIVSKAEHPYGIYTLETDPSGKWWVLLGYVGRDIIGPLNSEAEAKAETQRDFVRRIHAVLFETPAPQPREVGRDDRL